MKCEVRQRRINLSRIIRDCERIVVPDAGHLWILVHLREVPEAMTGSDTHRAGQRGAA